jgi:hypothetical protein
VIGHLSFGNGQWKEKQAQLILRLFYFLQMTIAK